MDAKNTVIKPAPNFVAVRFPRSLQQALKIAAAKHDPPVTMGEYLIECFEKVQKAGGLAEYAKTKGGART